MSITSKQAGMVPGCGLDSRIREVRNSGINYDRVEDTQAIDIGKVHRVEQVVCEVRNNVELANTLGCELGVSLVSMPLGVGAKLARGTRFSQHKKYYATSIEKVIIEKNLVKPCLHNEAIDILNSPEYDLIQTKRMAIESVSSKVLALETYMTRLNNAEFYQKDSQLAKNIYNAKAGVYNALDILNTWLQAAIYSKGFDIFERIPNLSISNIVIEEVPFY
jgi:hypothetical protein